MISEAAFNLTGTISRMVQSRGTEADIEKFKKDLDLYVMQKQRSVATRLLERIYDNDRQALRKDIESSEVAKIMVIMDEKEVSVSELDRRKLIRILYPVLQEEFGIKL